MRADLPNLFSGGDETKPSLPILAPEDQVAENRPMKKYLVPHTWTAVLARLALAVFLGSFLVGCSGSEDVRATSVPLDEIIEETGTVVDTARATAPNGDFPGADTRTIAYRLWYAPFALQKPACEGRECALLLFAHGFGGRAERFDAIAKRLAAQGYIVVAPTFPLTNQDAPGGFSNAIADVTSQPQDLSFVLDHLSELAADPSAALYRRIDLSRVGAMGHSLGGTTVIAVTRLDCCRDSRITATAYVEPGTTLTSAFFGEEYASEGPPSLTFHGELGIPFSPEVSREFHYRLAPPSILVEILGGNHINLIERFADKPDPLLEETASIMIPFFDKYLGGRDGTLTTAIEELESRGHRVDFR